MKVLNGFNDPACHGGFVAIGNFDGVHLGHRAMLGRLRARATEARVPAIVVTFDPHPIAVLRPGQVPAPLTTLDRRLELIGACDVDCVIVYPTDRQLLQLSAREFFDRVIRNQLEVRGLVEGTNFCFGKNRGGTVELLTRWCDDAGLACEIIPPLTHGGAVVSSSSIREQINRGDVAQAAEFLATPYLVSGIVAHGDARGAKIGFPTANIEHVETLLPADGVYAGRCHCAAGTFAAAINLGTNPTFGGMIRKFEAHLLDFAGDLYGQTVRVEWIERLRGTRPFSGIEELVGQLRHDVARTRELVRV